MIGSSNLPDSVATILVTRLDGLGDIVLGTMLLNGLHAKWPQAKVHLLVRPELAGVGSVLPEWVTVHGLPFDVRGAVAGQETQIVEHLRTLAPELKAELAIVAEYNRNWASDILAVLSGAQAVVAFSSQTGVNVTHTPICTTLGVGSFDHWQTVQADSESRESQKYAALLAAVGIDAAGVVPSINVREEDRKAAAGLWEQTGVDAGKSVVCFPGCNEGAPRSLSAAQWVRWITNLQLNRPVVLLGSDADEPVLEEIAASGLSPDVARVVLPPEHIGVMTAFIELGGAYIGMDTGPMHIAATLGRPTLGVFGGGHRAYRFLPVGRRAAAVRMPLGCYGCDWHCPFDRKLCIKDMPEKALLDAGKAFLANTADNASPFSPLLFDLKPPFDLPTVLLGPVMRQNRQFLKHNHEIIEHHAYLSALHSNQSKRLEYLTDTLSRLTQENHERRETLAAFSQNIATFTETIAEMSRQNAGRDEAITKLNDAIAEMTNHNGSRDQAIAHVSATLDEMSRQNAARDEAIAHINRNLAEMTMRNEARDQAINVISQRTETQGKKRK